MSAVAWQQRAGWTHVSMLANHKDLVLSPSSSHAHRYPLCQPDFLLLRAFLPACPFCMPVALLSPPFASTPSCMRPAWPRFSMPYVVSAGTNQTPQVEARCLLLTVASLTPSFQQLPTMCLAFSCAWGPRPPLLKGRPRANRKRTDAPKKPKPNQSP